jgi:hypothetical protein
MAKAKGTKGISSEEFVKTYAGSKTLQALKTALKAVTKSEWDEKKIDAKLSGLRKKGVPLKTLIQRGWVESSGKGPTKVDVDKLTALLAETDAMATEKQMPKPKKTTT